LGDGSEGIGSNSWAVAGSMTATGGAMLANDPHLAPALPSIWYQVRLRCAPVSEACPYDVAGFSFSGMPGIIIGHNDRIAYGFTNLGPDVADLVVERLDGSDVVTAGGAVPLEVRTETIRVAGGDDVVHEVRVGPHGPLISDVGDDYGGVASGPLAAGAPDGDAFAVALRWVALDPAPTADAIPLLMRARDFTEFRAAGARLQVPSQNLLYADVDGHIGYQAPGLIPVRDGHDGTLPTVGWEGGAAWTRFLAFDELPYVLDPAGGVISTANQLVLPPGTTPFLHVDVSYGQRGRRIAQLLDGRTALTLDDLAAIQMDAHNANAEVLVPHLLAVTTSDAGARELQALLATWDLQDDVDSAASAAFNATWRALLRLTFHDELPEWAWPTGGGRWWEVVRGLVDDPTHPWWSDAVTGEALDRDAVAVGCHPHADAAARDVRLVGHRAGRVAVQPPAGCPRDLRRDRHRELQLLERGRRLRRGLGALDADAGRPDRPRRRPLDPPDGPVGTTVPRQLRRRDLAERWRTGGYVPMRFSPAATSAAAVDVLTLTPTG
ncbi:MAG: hypothetical protein RLZZ353_1274, partial [Actinomycetota bacterium]